VVVPGTLGILADAVVFVQHIRVGSVFEHQRTASRLNTAWISGLFIKRSKASCGL
jgi:hypothetical protein